MKKLIVLLAISLLLVGCGQETKKVPEGNVTGNLRVVEVLSVDGARIYKVIDDSNKTVIYAWNGYGGISVINPVRTERVLEGKK